MTKKERTIRLARDMSKDGELRIRDCEKIFNLSRSAIECRMHLPEGHPNALRYRQEAGKKGRIFIYLESVLQSIVCWSE
jgi:hypothetical protein